jgi:hypothetical protein
LSLCGFIIINIELLEIIIDGLFELNISHETPSVCQFFWQRKMLFIKEYFSNARRTVVFVFLMNATDLHLQNVPGGFLIL